MRWFTLDGRRPARCRASELPGGYWLSERGTLSVVRSTARKTPSDHAAHAGGENPGGRRVLYYKDPMGGPDTSPVPKKDWMGMDYIPVYADEAAEARRTVMKITRRHPPLRISMPTTRRPRRLRRTSTATRRGTAASSRGDRKPLYYRNPMGLPDTSPVPKKDSMGMDYIPVYPEDVDAAAQGFVKISPERVQMIGVQSEAVVTAKSRPADPRRRHACSSTNAGRTSSRRATRAGSRNCW